MNSFIFAINAVLPIILTVLIGYFLGRIGLFNKDTAKAVNKLVFRVFLPVMLFLNVYKIESIEDIEPGYIIYALCSLLVIYALSILVTLISVKDGSRRGVLLQGSFRSNFALIGIPLAVSLFGDEGAIVASLLSIVIIPSFNVLAVISLSVFGEEKKKINVGKIILGIIKNPLIIGVASGLAAFGVKMLMKHFGIDFMITDIEPIGKTLSYLSSLATPLALLVLGAQFEFSAIGSMKKEIITGTLMRCLIVPIIGLGGAYLLFRDVFSGAHFAAFVAMYTTPVAVSSVPMAQEMGGDSALAGQLVVFTTLFSSLTIFFASYLLKMAGVF
jgi:predicted permease